MLAFGSYDLWPSLLNIGLVLVAIATVVGVVVWRGRRRGSRTIALDAALTVSGWWVMLSLIGVAIIIVKAFAVDWAEFHGATHVYVDWPASLPCSDSDAGSTARLSCGGESLSDFTVGNASLGLRLLAAGAQLSTLALTTMPALILAFICFHTLRGRTFSRIITRALVIGAIAVLLLGVSADLLGSIAATTGLREVFPPDSEWFPSSYQLIVTPLPFGGAIALAALAAVFREGSRLQSEREHLQRENAALEKETEGLV